jgi:Protein of unknown function (DUF3800)
MAREPRPHEAHLFQEIYVDESSVTRHRFLVLGGVMFPRRLSAQFEEHILEARSPKLRSIDSRGKLREIGWTDVSTGDFEAYKKVVDGYFSFPSHHMQGSLEPYGLYCSVVDTHVLGRAYSGKRGKIGFNREIYYHCLSIARRNPNNLFHVYPDHRSVDEPITKMAAILSRGMAKTGDNRDWPFRRVQFRFSHEWQAIQVSDVFIGAVAYRLNRHYDAPGANADKKQLCDYILRRTKFAACFTERTVKKKTWGSCQLWLRRHRKTKVPAPTPSRDGTG